MYLTAPLVCILIKPYGNSQFPGIRRSICSGSNDVKVHTTLFCETPFFFLRTPIVLLGPELRLNVLIFMAISACKCSYDIL